MKESPDTEDIESFWEGLRPPRDPSTFTNVSVEGADLEVPVEEESIPYVTRYTVDYGDDSPVEIEESRASFSDTSILTDPPYSSHLSGTDRANLSLFREIVYTTGRLQQLLESAGIAYNFTRLISVIDEGAVRLNVQPASSPVSYFREELAFLSYPEVANARR